MRISLSDRSPRLRGDTFPRSHQKMSHGPVSSDNVRETGVSPMDGRDPPSWPRRRSRSSELKIDLVTGPIRGFCAYRINHFFYVGYREDGWGAPANEPAMMVTLKGALIAINGLTS
jgi:hypothetical protein